LLTDIEHLRAAPRGDNSAANLAPALFIVNNRFGTDRARKLNCILFIRTLNLFNPFRCLRSPSLL
jgi:hypothetical protein